MRVTIRPVRGVLLAGAALGALIAFGVGADRAGADGAQGATFVGANACKKCHLKQHKSWKETSMAKAFETLKPGAKEKEKAQAGLDATKDYTQDEKCAKCHTTGYGEPGGYPKLGAPAEAEAKAAREGVQCESCHGAGSLYLDYMKKHEKEGYVAEEAAKLGLVTGKEETCLTCHKGGPDGSPTMKADEKFDAAKGMKDEKAMHVHPPKKEKK